MSKGKQHSSPKIIQFQRGGSKYKEIVLSLGEHMSISWGGAKRNNKPHCVFIKATPKGFNFLDLDTNRTILKRHVYARKMVGKEYPSRGPIREKFYVPLDMNIDIKYEEHERTS